jgi:hypothetical protein
MKREKKTKLRERDGRNLSSYARKGKVPFRYGAEDGEMERLVHAPHWRMPRNAKGHRTQPRAR